MSQSSGSIDRFIKFRAKNDNPDEEHFPISIPPLGSAIPGFEFIAPNLSGDRSGTFIQPGMITDPASGSADRPRYSEHPA
eukprot:10478138-Heterocapsa_arctica.AAC.1